MGGDGETGLERLRQHCQQGDHTAKNQISKQIFPEKELRGHSPNFHIHVSVSDFIYSHDHRSAYSAAGNMWADPGNI